MQRYAINVIIDHTDANGAPVVFEDHPKFPYLIGRIEHVSEMGTLVTNFNLIRAGSLHRANGGYLVLDAGKLLVQPFAWEGLKRALKSGEIRIKSLGEALSLVSTVTLEPQPIPLDAKIILLGDRMLYYLLQAYDPEFLDLFKVAADFEGRTEIQQAIDTRIRRASRIRDRLQEEILRDTVLIDSDGECIGQVNGLAAAQIGESTFAHPCRITARVALG